MQILLAVIFGAVVGLGLHFGLAGRDLRGVALAPMLCAAAAAVVWVALTWAGQTIDGPWIWLASLLAPVVVGVPAVIGLTELRRRSDARRRAALGLR